MTDQPSDPRASSPGHATGASVPGAHVEHLEHHAPAPAPGGDGAPGPRPTPPVHYERRKRHVGWRSRDILRTAALVIAFYLVLRLLWFAQQLVLVTFLGVLFGLATTAAVDRLERWRIPRGVGAALTVFGTIGIIVAFFAWTAPTLREQSHELRTKLPEAIDKAQGWLEKRQSGLMGLLGNGPGGAPAPAQPGAADSTRRGPARDTVARDTARRAADTAAAGAERRPVGPIAGTVSTAPRVVDSLRNRVAAPGERPEPKAAGDSAAGGGGLAQGMGGIRRFLFSFVTSTFAAFGGLLLVLFLAIYVATNPGLYHDGLMKLFPRQARRRAGEVLSAVAVVLRRWLVTQLIAMVAIGGVTTIVLLLLHVKAAFPLGILAGLLEFVPTIGPIMSAVPAIAMGFVDSPQKALWVAVAYVGIQFLENHILIPLLMKEGVDLPPAMTIITQALMALLFGFLGLLVAVPMLAAATVVVRMLYVEDVVGEPAPVPDDDDDDD